MNRIVDDQITLIPYYRNDAISLLWYQDSDVCKQVDNTDQIYDITKLHKMYDGALCGYDCDSFKCRC